MAAGGVIAPIIFAAGIAIAGSAQDGYSHVDQKISELGGTGAVDPWIQNLNFYMMGLLVVGFAAALHRSIDNGRGSIVGPAFIAVFGISSAGLNGIFHCDASCEGLTAAGKLHLVTGVAGFLSMIIGLFVVRRRMVGTEIWRGWARYTLVTASLSVVGLIAFIAVDSDLESTIAGLVQRLFVALFLLWLAVTGIWILRNPELTAGE